MSDEVKTFKQDWVIVQEIEKKKLEVQAKKTILDERRYNSELEKIAEADKSLDIAKNTNFGAMSQEQIAKLKNDMKEYVMAAKEGMMFINKVLRDIVPFFRKNLIVVGARTGGGKSTAVANIVFETIKQKNPKTGESRKVLVITNEEKAEDFYSRIVSLARNYHYVNHDKFTPEMTAQFEAGIQALAGTGIVTVIDDNFNGTSGLTKTLEGIKTIFNNLIRDRIYYDAIIIDYYQNVTTSTDNPKLDQYKVQELLAHFLDGMKNQYPAPIVVFAQSRVDDKEHTIPFDIRLKGAKLLSDKATLTMEMIPHQKDLCTEWVVHKSRFTEGLTGHSIMTGYDKGRFVEYDEAFRAKAAKAKERRAEKALMGGIKLKDNEEKEGSDE